MDIESNEQPAAEPVAEPETSLAEHEAEFGEGTRRPEPDPEPEPDEDPRRPPRARDEAGKFVKPERHRAKSQEAGARDVPRIAELTKKLREAETERDALRARTGAPAAPAAAPVETKPAVAAAAKPKIEDFQEYGDYVEAVADWKIAEARKADRETQQKESIAAQVAQSWRERTTAAKERYPDFEQVALLAPTSIPQGSLIDAWILEDTTGADVLYTLQKDPAELRRILALPIFEQVKALALIGQRLSPSREAAVRTGAAPTPSQKVAPRPPTPVRTGAVPAPDEPPDYEQQDVSLATHEKWFGKRR